MEPLYIACIFHVSIRLVWLITAHHLHICNCSRMYTPPILLKTNNLKLCKKIGHSIIQSYRTHQQARPMPLLPLVTINVTAADS
jgi:hypothetical protein